MVLIDLQKITQALGLVSSIAKPIPVVGGVGSGLVDTVGGLVNSSVGSSTGALNGLLGGGAGILAVGIDDDSASGSNSGGDITTYSDDSANAAGSDDSCAFEPYAPAPVALESFAPYDADRALVYRYRQQQSVNLGSWFVQEQWMNPSLFKCASGNKQAEFDVASGWGSVDNARQVLERHWDEWITEADFAYLASIGINTVRLPIGFWSLGPVYCQGTVFESVSGAYVNAWPRVVRAINWAEKYGLGILVDLHGAPGSQNGQGHGGTSDGQQNLFNNPTNVQLTINILTYLTQQLVKVNNVVGIELLNEPSNVDSLPSFYTNALSVLRQVSPEAAAFPFYIHDGFDLSRFADYVSTRKDFVVLDHHSYFVFGDAASQLIPAKELATSLTPGSGSVAQQLIAAASEERRNIVIDEFSCALSGAALSNSPDAIADRRKFCTGQMESYTNATAGWSFWSYKTEACSSDDNWCFTSAVGKSLPATFFSYPNATVASLAAAALPSSDPAADPSFLSFGTSMPVDESYSPPTADDWLDSLGKGDSAYRNINEVLATTEYDNEATSQSDVGLTANAHSGPAITTQNLAQTPFTVETATIPSSRIARSLLSMIPSRAFLFASDVSKHRFVARHHRASARRHPIRRQEQYTPEQAAVSKGYADGWRAAKTFAAFGQSRLGFTGQFMDDAIAAMGSHKIVSGDESKYKTWFMKGLADGEMQVVKMMAMQSLGPA